MDGREGIMDSTSRSRRKNATSKSSFLKKVKDKKMNSTVDQDNFLGASSMAKTMKRAAKKI